MYAYLSAANSQCKYEDGDEARDYQNDDALKRLPQLYTKHTHVTPVNVIVTPQSTMKYTRVASVFQ